MNRLTSLGLGVFALFFVGWLALVAQPYLAFASLKPEKDPNTNALSPPGVPGAAKQGYQVYAANGCVYCHSQYVRDKAEGSDIDRQWGKRRTVARDYLNDSRVFLGTSRFGPDLTNVGVRHTDAQWFYQYLYDPRSVDPQSTMPSYRWLFNKARVSGEPAANALKLTGADAVPSGYQVVPTPEADKIVAYLLAMKRDYPLPEAPEPQE